MQFEVRCVSLFRCVMRSDEMHSFDGSIMFIL
jgi:hypothetical protein